MINVPRFYGAKKLPFTKNIEVSDLIFTEESKDILNRLIYAVEEQQFAVLTSGCGMGKTTMLRSLKTKLNSHKYMVFYISDSELSPRMLYRQMLAQLGLNALYYRGDSKALLYEQLEFLKKKKGKKVLTIIDESHLISHRAIEEIRFLLNYKMDSESPMALILAGQNELIEKLKKPTFAAVRQRIDMVCRLKALTREETEEYIKAHLTSTGCPTDIFTMEAIDQIYASSSGIARTINSICSKCMLRGTINNERIIKIGDVKSIKDYEMI